MEYILGPVVALMLGLKFTDYRIKKQKENYNTLLSRIVKVESASIESDEKYKSLLNKTVKVENAVSQSDKETAKKVLKTIQPVVVAVKNLNEFVGIK